MSGSGDAAAAAWRESAERADNVLTPLDINGSPIQSPQDIDRIEATIPVFTGRTPSHPLPFRAPY
jgi:hypothetical protein